MRAAPNDQLQLVTFELAGEEFAAPILEVQEIIRPAPITRVPQSPPEIEGVINLRGQIIPVMSLRRRFGLAPAAPSEQQRIIVARTPGGVVGFTVDRVNEVLRISAEAVEPAPGACAIDADCIAGVGKLHDRLLILLDLPRLLAPALAGSAGAPASKAA